MVVVVVVLQLQKKNQELKDLVEEIYRTTENLYAENQTLKQELEQYRPHLPGGQ